MDMKDEGGWGRGGGGVCRAEGGGARPPWNLGVLRDTAKEGKSCRRRYHFG